MSTEFCAEITPLLDNGQIHDAWNIFERTISERNFSREKITFLAGLVPKIYQVAERAYDLPRITSSATLMMMHQDLSKEVSIDFHAFLNHFMNQPHEMEFLLDECGTRIVVLYKFFHPKKDSLSIPPSYILQDLIDRLARKSQARSHRYNPWTGARPLPV